jgi:uncharacterized protein (TIGR03067 family)
MTVQVLLALAMSVGAPAAKDKPMMLSPVVGEWAVEAMTRDGVTNDIKDSGHVYTFQADGKLGCRSGKGPFSWHQYATDVKTTPPSLDIVMGDLDPRAGTRELYVFKIEGDTLTLCMSLDEKVRADSIDGTKGSKKLTLTLKRIGKPKE